MFVYTLYLQGTTSSFGRNIHHTQLHYLFYFFKCVLINRCCWIQSKCSQFIQWYKSILQNSMRNKTMYTLPIWGKAPCHKQRWLHHTCFRNWPSGTPEVLTCQVYRAAWCKTIDKIRVTNHKTILVKLVIRAKQIVQNTNDLKRKELETEVRSITKYYDRDDDDGEWWW